MAIKDEGELSDEERRGQEVAREIGALQKQARELERTRMERTPPQPRSYRKVPPKILFLGGATESSESEDADEAFRAADILRSRRVAEDEQTGDILRYKSGKKKGQPRHKPAGTLKDRNTRILSKHVGKKIRIVVDFDQLSEGGRVSKERRTTRTITYHDYDGLVRAYQDQMRATIKKKSADAYYVKAVSFVPISEAKPKKRKPVKRKPVKKKKSVKRGTKKKRASRRRPAVRRKPAKRSGRRVGGKRKRSKSAKTRKRA